MMREALVRETCFQKTLFLLISSPKFRVRKKEKEFQEILEKEMQEIHEKKIQEIHEKGKEKKKKGKEKMKISLMMVK